jgi:hypothetical protein
LPDQPAEAPDYREHIAEIFRQRARVQYHPGDDAEAAAPAALEGPEQIRIVGVGDAQGTSAVTISASS